MYLLNSLFKSGADRLDSYGHNTQSVASFLDKITKIVQSCNIFYNIMPWGERVHWWLLSSSRCNAHRFSFGLGNTLGYNPQFEESLGRVFASYFKAKDIKGTYLTGIDEMTIQNHVTAINEDLSRTYSEEVLFKKLKECAQWGTCSGQTDLLIYHSRLLKNQKASLEISKIEGYLLEKIDFVFRRQTLVYIFGLSANASVNRFWECFRGGDNFFNISDLFLSIPLNKDFISALETKFNIFLQLNSSSSVSERIFFGSIGMTSQENKGLHSMFFHIDCSDPNASRYIIYDPNSGLYQYSSLKEFCEGVFDITEARNKSPFISSHRSASYVNLEIKG